MMENQGQGINRRALSFLISIFCFLFTVFHTGYAGAVPLIRDAEIEHTLRVYGDPLFKMAGLKPSAIKLFIVNDDALNAFVAGGSNIFIHTGLIKACTTPDMLIGVMAHETGHISGGHLAQGSEKLKNAQIGSILTYVLGAAAAAASGKPEAAAAVITGGQTAVIKNFLAYTRAHEESADQAALGLLDKLHISSDGMLKVFALLQRHERESGGTRDPYMITHPLSSTRIDHVRNHVERSDVPEGQYPKSFDILHQRMLAKLNGFLDSPERTFQKYPITDKGVPARLARAVAYYKMPDLERSLKELDSLLAEAPKDPFFHELKGQILFENRRAKDALESYTEAVKLLPNSPLILTDLAKVELAQEPPMITSAIAHLEKANMYDTANTGMWRLLATAYGKAGNMGQSYLALAEESLLNDNPDTALNHVTQALTLLKKNTPSYQRAQDLKSHALEMKRIKKEKESTF